MDEAEAIQPKKKRLTNAMRAARYRMKNKEKVKSKNRQRMRLTRAVEKTDRASNPALQQEYREKERVRKMLYRQKKTASLGASTADSQETATSSFGTYKTPQSFGKAFKRSAAALPTSPRKKKAIIVKLASIEGIRLMKEQKKKEDNELQAKVKEFFARPDIVYVCPGLKDEVTVWNNGQKEKLRKCYMTMFLREAYSLFQESHPAVKIGFSTFCKQRPQNVLLLHETPADQCKCLTCENFFLQLGSLQIKYNSSFWANALCDDSLVSKCWQGDCDNCKEGQQISISSELSSDMAKTVTRKMWTKGVDSRLHCVVTEQSIGEILSSMQEDFKSVAQHINLKRIQADEFAKDKNNERVRILQMDFAMNFSCEYQNEVQSALWSRGSVTLFTAAAMHKGSCQTYLICSDTKEKEKNTVAAFVNHLYDKELVPDSPVMQGTEEVIWTDGPSSEFKNRFMASLLKELSVKYNKTFTWKYFATSHGKGVVDGVGGRAKSLVRSAVMSKRKSAPVVQSASDFAGVVSKLMPSTKVILIEDKDIPRSSDVWNQADAVPGIKNLHMLRSSLNQDLLLFRHAQMPLTKPTAAASLLLDTEQTQIFKENDWVLVKYDEQTYPGTVTAVAGTEVEVSVMELAGNTGKLWKWPVKVDKIFYTRDNVLCHIDPPEPAGTRGQYRFSNLKKL